MNLQKKKKKWRIAGFAAGNRRGKKLVCVNCHDAGANDPRPPLPGCAGRSGWGGQRLCKGAPVRPPAAPQGQDRSAARCQCPRVPVADSEAVPAAGGGCGDGGFGAAWPALALLRAPRSQTDPGMPPVPRSVGMGCCSGDADSASPSFLAVVRRKQDTAQRGSVPGKKTLREEEPSSLHSCARCVSLGRGVGALGVGSPAADSCRAALFSAVALK